MDVLQVPYNPNNYFEPKTSTGFMKQSAHYIITSIDEKSKDSMDTGSVHPIHFQATSPCYNQNSPDHSTLSSNTE
jgi:hypothetical protein